MKGLLTGLKRQRLKYKLLLLILLQTLVLLLVYLYAANLLEKDMVQKLVEHNSRVNYQNTAAARITLEEMKNLCASTLRLDNSDSVRQNELILRQLDQLVDINLSFRNHSKLWNKSLVDNPYLNTVAMSTVSGTTVFMTTGSEVFYITLSGPGEGWFSTAMAGRGDYHYSREDGMLRVSRAIVNPTKYEKQGVFTMLCSLDFLRDHFEGNRLFADEAYGLFVNGVQAAGDLDLSPGEIAAIVEADTRYGSVLMDRKAGTVTLFHRQEDPEEIISITRIPYAAVSSLAMRQNMGAIVLIVLYALGSFVINMVVIRSMVKSLGVFEGAFRQMGEGQFGQVLDVPVEREFQGFLDSYNRMSLRLGELIHEVYERGLTEHQLELQMLRNQINPHFFYNTLEALRMNSLHGNEGDNVRMIEYLGTILRYGVSSGSDPVSLEDELRHLEYYVELHNLRSDTHIILRTFVPEELRSRETLRLLFQPVVENSIYHGITGADSSLEIRVMAYQEGDDLTFTVTDNGAGISPEDAEAINRSLEGRPSGGKTGIGLRNVHRRLQLQYGPGYGLSIQSRSGRGTAVIIKTPCRNKQDKQLGG